MAALNYIIANINMFIYDGNTIIIIFFSIQNNNKNEMQKCITNMI